MDIKKLIAGVAIAGTTLTFGAAGTAFAADGPTGGSAPPAAATHRGKGHQALRHRVRKQALAVVLAETHTTRQQLRAALEGGQSIADFAAAHGSSGTAVSTALVNHFDSVIDKAVSTGKLTPARAATLKAKLPALATKIVDRTWHKV